VFSNTTLSQNRINQTSNSNKKKLGKETAQAIYREWFEFEFPDENGKPLKAMRGKCLVE